MLHTEIDKMSDQQNPKAILLTAADRIADRADQSSFHELIVLTMVVQRRPSQLAQSQTSGLLHKQWLDHVCIGDELVVLVSGARIETLRDEVNN